MWKLARSGSGSIAVEADQVTIAAPTVQVEASAKHAITSANPLLGGLLVLQVPYLKESLDQ